jgi:NADPH-dependent 2,4-dienoyl-CoA reductase/sulfur reductase-like enzyme
MSTPSPTRVVIVGGDAAGMSAASQAKRTAGPGQIEITAFERGPRTSYAACGLPYLVGGLVESPARLIARTPEQFAERGIRVHTMCEVVEIDLEARTVTSRDLLAGELEPVGWDELVVATGAAGILPPVEGIDARGVMQLRTVDDAVELRRLVEQGARSAVVVGAGYIGIEIAEGLVERGLHVEMLELADDPMAGSLDPDMAGLVTTAIRSAGVELHLGDALTGFDVEGGALAAVRSAQGRIDADVAVLALGIRPNSQLASDAGIPVGASGGIVVDDRMHTPVEGVWAAGDCVESLHRVTSKPAVVALGTHANRQGRVLGTNLAGGDATFPGVIGTAITRFGETEIARSGLTLEQAHDAGIPAEATVSTSRTRAGYFPGASEITTRLVYKPSDGTLLGAQIVGGPGAGKRIDILAMAIWTGMPVDELADVDLSYAPPFSPTFDPVSLAAGQAATARRAAPPS